MDNYSSNSRNTRNIQNRPHSLSSPSIKSNRSHGSEDPSIYSDVDDDSVESTDPQFIAFENDNHENNNNYPQQSQHNNQNQLQHVSQPYHHPHQLSQQHHYNHYQQQPQQQPQQPQQQQQYLHHQHQQQSPTPQQYRNHSQRGQQQRQLLSPQQPQQEQLQMQYRQPSQPQRHRRQEHQQYDHHINQQKLQQTPTKSSVQVPGHGTMLNENQNKNLSPPPSTMYPPPRQIIHANRNNFGNKYSSSSMDHLASAWGSPATSPMLERSRSNDSASSSNRGVLFYQHIPGSDVAVSPAPPVSISGVSPVPLSSKRQMAQNDDQESKSNLPLPHTLIPSPSMASPPRVSYNYQRAADAQTPSSSSYIRPQYTPMAEEEGGGRISPSPVKMTPLHTVATNVEGEAEVDEEIDTYIEDTQDVKRNLEEKIEVFDVQNTEVDDTRSNDDNNDIFPPVVAESIEINEEGDDNDHPDEQILQRVNSPSGMSSPGLAAFPSRVSAYFGSEALAESEVKDVISDAHINTNIQIEPESEVTIESEVKDVISDAHINTNIQTETESEGTAEIEVVTHVKEVEESEEVQSKQSEVVVVNNIEQVPIDIVTPMEENEKEIKIDTGSAFDQENDLAYVSTDIMSGNNIGPLNEKVMLEVEALEIKENVGMDIDTGIHMGKVETMELTVYTPAESMKETETEGKVIVNEEKYELKKAVVDVMKEKEELKQEEHEIDTSPEPALESQEIGVPDGTSPSEQVQYISPVVDNINIDDFVTKEEYSSPIKMLESSAIGIELEEASTPPPVIDANQCEWTEYYSDEGWPYYYNSNTGESSWEAPEYFNTTHEAKDAACQSTSKFVHDDYNHGQERQQEQYQQNYDQKYLQEGVKDYYSQDQEHMSSSSNLQSLSHSQSSRTPSQSSNRQHQTLQQSPLHAACETTMESSLQLLLQAGAFAADELDANGRTPLLLLCTSDPSSKAPGDMARCARVLLDYGADPNQVDHESGDTLLHMCVSHLNVELLAVLLDYHADVDAVDFSGETALHRAARVGELESLRLLSQAQVEIHGQRRAPQSQLQQQQPSRSAYQNAMQLHRQQQQQQQQSYGLNSPVVVPSGLGQLYYQPSVNVYGQETGLNRSYGYNDTHINGHANDVDSYHSGGGRSGRSSGGSNGRNSNHSYEPNAARSLLIDAGRKRGAVRDRETRRRDMKLGLDPNGEYRREQERAARDQRELRRRRESDRAKRNANATVTAASHEWERYYAADGRPYYYHKISKQVTWDPPPGYRGDSYLDPGIDANIAEMNHSDINSHDYSNGYINDINNTSTRSKHHQRQSHQKQRSQGMKTTTVDAYGRRIAVEVDPDNQSLSDLSAGSGSFDIGISEERPNHRSRGRNDKYDGGYLNDNVDRNRGRNRKQKDALVHNEARSKPAPVAKPEVVSEAAAAPETEQDKHLTVWNRFFQNAMLMSENMDLEVLGLGLPKLPKARKGEWPEQPGDELFEEMLSAAIVGIPDGMVVAPSGARAIALNTALIAASMRAEVNTMEMLMVRGANHSCVDDQIRSPAHHAAYATSSAGYDALALLADCNAQLEVRDLSGQTPLHVAAMRGSEEATRCLLESAVDVDVNDDKGCVPLHYAAQGGHVQVCALLIEYGATVRATNTVGQSPMSMARSARPHHKGHGLVIEHLAEAYVTASHVIAGVTATETKKLVSPPKSASTTIIDEVKDAVTDLDKSVDYVSLPDISSPQKERDKLMMEQKQNNKRNGVAMINPNTINGNIMINGKGNRTSEMPPPNDEINGLQINIDDTDRDKVNKDTNHPLSSMSMSNGTSFSAMGPLESPNSHSSSNSPGPGFVTAGSSSGEGPVSPSLRERRVYPHLRVDTNATTAKEADKLAGAINLLPVGSARDARSSGSGVSRADDRRPWVSSDESSSDSDSDSSSDSNSDDGAKTGVSQIGSNVVGGVWNVASALVGATLSVFSRGPGKEGDPTPEELGIDDIWKGAAAPPTDNELEQIGLGFATMAKRSPAYATVRNDINETITAMRSGMTPRRAQTPKPPSEVAAAVAKAKSATRSNGVGIGSTSKNKSKSKSKSKNKAKGQLPIGLPARIEAEEAARSLADKGEMKAGDMTVSASSSSSLPPPRKNSYSLGAGGAQLASKQRYVDVLGDIQRSNSNSSGGK